MRNHKGLELEEMIWWLSKDGQAFKLEGQNDQYTATVTQTDGTESTGTAGSALAATGIVFDKVYGDEEDKHTIRNLFSKFTCGLINNTMAETAEEELESASE